MMKITENQYKTTNVNINHQRKSMNIHEHQRIHENYETINENN